ncbi:hypothetical protein AAG906_021419 [Vitis piasezkii]
MEGAENASMSKNKVYGRDTDVNAILGRLLSENDEEKSRLYIIAIVGTGGMGKTTLAQLAYNHPEKFLLVLDDMWTEDYRLWEQLKNTLNYGAVGGSRILVTTRKDNVAKMMGTTYKHPIGELSPQHAQVLFHQIAFFGKSREQVEELKEIERSFPALLLSYYDLPPAIKRCFSYCAVFPKDADIRVDKLIKLWMAQNYLNSDGSKEMETVGREYFDYLAAGSFFQDFQKDDDDDDIKKREQGYPSKQFVMPP